MSDHLRQPSRNRPGRLVTSYEPVASTAATAAQRAASAVGETDFINPTLAARKPASAEPQPAHALDAKNLATRRRATKREEQGDTAATPADKLAASTRWLLKRGHGLTFLGLFLFTAVLYFRPYELIPALSSLSSLAFWIALATLLIFLPTQLGLEGNLTARPREVNLALIFTLLALLSIPLATDRWVAWEKFSGEFIKVVLMFVVMVNVVRTPRRLRWLLALMLAVGIMLSYNAINDFRLGNTSVEKFRVSGTIGGMFGNPNELATNLVTMIPIAIALVFGTRNPVKRILFFGVALLMAGGLLVTYSRGGILGLSVAAVFFGWKVRRGSKAVSFALFACFGAMVLLAIIGGFAFRFASVMDHSLEGGGSASHRQDLLFESIKVALRYPILGVGMDNHSFKMSRGLVSHNAYTQVAADLGLAAMAVFIMFLVTPLKRLRVVEEQTRGTRSETWFYYLSVGMQASIVGYMVSAFFISSAYQWYTFYLVGYAVCLRRVYDSTRQEAAERAASAGARRRAVTPVRAESNVRRASVRIENADLVEVK